MELVLSMTLMFSGHKVISLQEHVKNSGGPSMEIRNDREQSSIVYLQFHPFTLVFKDYQMLAKDHDENLPLYSKILGRAGPRIIGEKTSMARKASGKLIQSI